LPSTGSRSDYSSCDAKKVKIVKLQLIMIVVIQALILTLRVKMPILPVNMQVLMEMQLLKNRIMILTLKIQVLVEMETNDKKVKIHLKTMLLLKIQMQMKMRLLRNRSIILTMKIPMIMKMEKKNHGSKNASENDTASKENTSNAVQGELKDHDKLYFVSPSEELNAYIATTNKNNST